MIRYTTLLFAFLNVASLFGQGLRFGDPVKLNGAVNGEKSEESIPVFSDDSSTLYFVRTFDESSRGGLYDQDVWYSARQEDGSYGEVKSLKTLNNKLNNAIVGLGKKSGAMYLLNAYEGKKDTVKGIAMAERNGTGWSKPKKIEIPTLDIPGNFYGFHVNRSEDVILISYNGPGSMGEEDLYISINENGSWSVPMHMGRTVNSSGFEISPFLSVTGDTLFFSSNGHGGLGNSDIFYAVKQGDWTSWSKPVNLGASINTSKFDAYFIFAGNEGFWASNRENERSDIYRAELLPSPPLFANAVGTDVTTHKGSDGKIDCTPDGGVPPYSYQWSNGSTDEDLQGLVAGTYFVMVTDAIGQTADVTVDIAEPPLELDPVEARIFDNPTFEHFFTYNKNKVEVNGRKMKKFTREILNQLKDGRGSVTIKVNSSASHVPTKKFGSNEKLARLRAENIKYDLVQWFQKKGVSNQVVIIVETSAVQGPEYENDESNRSKYEDFQYVRLVTE